MWAAEIVSAGELVRTIGVPLRVADIAPTDTTFISEGCGTWSRDPDSIVTPGQPFGDGTYVVGLDVEPGRYRVAAPSAACHWIRLADFRAVSDYYGENLRSIGRGWGPVIGRDTIAIVDIEPGDAGFHSEGCGTWTGDLTSIVTPGQPFGDGGYIVGDEIAPGRYRAREPSAECHWVRLADFSGVYGSTSNRFIPRRSGPTSIADIAPGDAGFHSEGCGTWTDDLTPIVAPGEPFADGTYLVGVDIAPGRYRTTTSTEDCGWHRLYDFAGIYRPYEGLYTISSDRIEIVDIAPTDTGFTTSGCGTWTADLTPVVTPGQPFADGTYLVGPEIAPGRYYASAPTASCYWIRLGSFDGDSHYGYDWSDDLIASASSTIVDILATDLGFRSSGCGGWSTSTARGAEPERSFNDGTYLVGVHIAAGRYYATAPSDRCNWDRLDTFEGSRDWSDLGIGGRYEWASPTKLAVVDIKPSDAGFRSRGCGEWTQTFEPRVTPGEPPGDGFFLVGSEVAPGRYRALSPTTCSFERRSAFSGEYLEGTRYIDEGRAGETYASPDGSLAIVDIEPTDAGFRSTGCAWTADLTPLSRPGRQFGSGTRVVGPDIAPGRYRAAPSDGDRCSWWRLSKFGGLYGNDSGVVGRWWVRGQSDIVDIAPGDAGFHSSGCRYWTPDLSPVLAPGEPFTGGTYLVGTDLPPGRYRAASADPESSCYWARLSGFGGTEGEIIASSEFRGASFIVEIAPSDAGFSTDPDCGAWEPDSGAPRRSPGPPLADGVYYVGTEIAPGRYRAISPHGEAWCEWWRLSGFGGTPGEVIGSYALEDMLARSFIVDVAEPDAGFASTGCGTWTNNLRPIISPGDPFGTGSWLVGPEVAPGRYRNTPGETHPKGIVFDAECEWRRVSGFGGSAAETIESGGTEPGGVTTVEIAAADAGFVSRGCGTWTPVPR